MPVDPQIRALVEQGAGLPAIETLTVGEARRMFEVRARRAAPSASVAAISERSLAGPAGSIRVRIYSPSRTRPAPLMVFYHGGGFVLGTLDTHDGICRNLCAGTGCVVVSVDYRLAPEHVFPAAVDDCLAATRWAATYANEIGASAGRIIVAGDSAGGNLATVVALRLRDEGGPKLAGQLLFYPVTDYHTPGTPSYQDDALGYGLTRDAMKWFWAHYLPDATWAQNADACPLRAQSLAGLPPTLVMTAEYDPLRDEAELYSERLREAGVSARVSRWSGLNHGFLLWVGVVEKSGLALAEACDWTRRVLAGEGC